MKRRIILYLLPLLFLSCEKLPEAPTSPLKMTVDRTTVDIYPDVPATVNFTVENYEGKNVGYSLSPVKSNIDAVLKTNTDGTGSITFTMKNDSESQTVYTLTAKTNQRTGEIETASCEILVRPYSPEPQDGLSFDDGTKTKAFKFMDSERVFTLGLNWGPDDMNVVVSNEAQDWCKAVITDRKTLNVWITANEGASVRRGFVTVNGTVTVSFEQYGAQMEGSLRDGLMAFYNALHEKGQWQNIYNWGKSGNYLEWDAISADNTSTLEAFSNNKEVYCGTDDLWNIRFPEEYMGYLGSIYGKVPQKFWNIAKYFRRIDLSGCLNICVEGLPEQAFHEEIVEFKLHKNYLEMGDGMLIDEKGYGGNFDLIYNCPKIERFAISTHEAYGTLDERILALTHLKEFNIYGNYVSGYIPKSIGLLENLEVFTLGGAVPYDRPGGEYEDPVTKEASNKGFYTNHWTGTTLPDSFYWLTNLRKVEIDFLPFTDEISPEIGNLQNLEYLSFWHCSFTGKIPEEIGTIKSLRKFNWGRMNVERLPEFLRYIPLDWHQDEPYWLNSVPMGGIASSDTNLGKWIRTPKWWYERYGAELGYTESKVPVYPYADDLQYPATEYFYDGKDWRHPNYEHPARYYHKVNGTWQYDPNWDWNADDEHQLDDKDCPAWKMKPTIL